MYCTSAFSPAFPRTRSLRTDPWTTSNRLSRFWDFRFSELNMLVRFEYQTHLDFQPQPNFCSSWFQEPPSFFLALLPQPNSFFFVMLDKTNRKYEPFWYIRCGILVVILVVIFFLTFGESSMCRQQTRTPVRGLTNLVGIPYMVRRWCWEIERNDG